MESLTTLQRWSDIDDGSDDDDDDDESSDHQSSDISDDDVEPGKDNVLPQPQGQKGEGQSVEAPLAAVEDSANKLHLDDLSSSGLQTSSESFSQPSPSSQPSQPPQPTQPTQPTQPPQPPQPPQPWVWREHASLDSLKMITLVPPYLASFGSFKGMVGGSMTMFDVWCQQGEFLVRNLVLTQKELHMSYVIPLNEFTQIKIVEGKGKHSMEIMTASLKFVLETIHRDIFWRLLQEIMNQVGQAATTEAVFDIRQTAQTSSSSPSFSFPSSSPSSQPTTKPQNPPRTEPGNKAEKPLPKKELFPSMQLLVGIPCRGADGEELLVQFETNGKLIRWKAINNPEKDWKTVKFSKLTHVIIPSQANWGSVRTSITLQWELVSLLLKKKTTCSRNLLVPNNSIPDFQRAFEWAGVPIKSTGSNTTSQSAEIPRKLPLNMPKAQPNKAILSKSAANDELTKWTYTLGGNDPVVNGCYLAPRDTELTFCQKKACDAKCGSWRANRFCCDEWFCLECAMGHEKKTAHVPATVGQCLCDHDHGQHQPRSACFTCKQMVCGKCEEHHVGHDLEKAPAFVRVGIESNMMLVVSRRSPQTSQLTIHETFDGNKELLQFGIDTNQDLIVSALGALIGHEQVRKA